MFTDRSKVLVDKEGELGDCREVRSMVAEVVEACAIRRERSMQLAGVVAREQRHKQAGVLPHPPLRDLTGLH